MVISLEISRPFQLRPGRIRTVLGERCYHRAWWLWFAVAYWPGDQIELSDAIRRGEWRDH